jgi:hypothetical protein
MGHGNDHPKLPWVTSWLSCRRKRPTWLCSMVSVESRPIVAVLPRADSAQRLPVDLILPVGLITNNDQRTLTDIIELAKPMAATAIGGSRPCRRAGRAVILVKRSSL